MEKRLFLAVFLSIAFLFAWGAIAPRLFPDLAPEPTPDVAMTTTAPAARTAPDAPAPPSSTPAAPRPAEPSAPATGAPAPTIAAPSESTVQIESPLYRATFSNRGGQLVSLLLHGYRETKGGPPVDLVSPRPAAGRLDHPFAILTADERLTRTLNEGLYTTTRTREGEETVLRFRWAGSGVTVEKTFRFREDDYLFSFDVAVTPTTVPWRIEFGPGLRRILPEEANNRFISTGNGVYQSGGEMEILQRDDVEGFTLVEGLQQFTGLEDNYFLAVLKPERGGAATFRPVTLPSPVEGGDPRTELYAGLNAAGDRVRGEAFFGPKEASRLDRHGLDASLQFGIFGFIARILLAALLWINNWTLNYGWAIVALTFVIKLLLYPLQHKSMVSMKKMQLVQPKMNAIKERYKKAKTDPEQRQKMNVEMMKLYKQEGINPASGCVPLLLQLPILWAFYTLLSRAIELRGAPWILWIEDLSVKDPYYITPILMTATMFIQQLITPSTVDPVQRKVFLAMPFIFGWMFKEFPSGLVLYWLVQNILSIVQQLITNKYWHTPRAEKGA